MASARPTSAQRATRRHVARWNRQAPPVMKRIERLARTRWKLAPEQAHDLAFHLTDWIVELEAVWRLYRSRRWRGERAASVLEALVVHAPAHLAAAHRLLLDLPVGDPFELGAVRGTGRPPPSRHR